MEVVGWEMFLGFFDVRDSGGERNAGMRLARLGGLDLKDGRRRSGYPVPGSRRADDGVDVGSV